MHPEGKLLKREQGKGENEVTQEAKTENKGKSTGN